MTQCFSSSTSSQSEAYLSKKTKRKISDVVQLLFPYVSSKDGMRAKIMLDRDPLFKSKYFEGITDMLNSKKNMARKGHPQTDCKSANTIRTLRQMLRHIILKKPIEWDVFFSELEFQYKATKHNITKVTSFEFDLGYVPQF